MSLHNQLMAELMTVCIHIGMLRNKLKVKKDDGFRKKIYTENRHKVRKAKVKMGLNIDNIITRRTGFATDETYFELKIQITF